MTFTIIYVRALTIKISDAVLLWGFAQPTTVAIDQSNQLLHIKYCCGNRLHLAAFIQF